MAGPEQRQNSTLFLSLRSKPLMRLAPHWLSSALRHAARRTLASRRLPTFEFKQWLTGLICAVVVLFALSPFFFGQARWVRPLGYFAGFINILNALGHTTATILGRTVASVPVMRPAPGFWSSPVLFVASVWLLLELRKSKTGRNMRTISSPETS